LCPNTMALQNSQSTTKVKLCPIDSLEREVVAYADYHFKMGKLMEELCVLHDQGTIGLNEHPCACQHMLDSTQDGVHKPDVIQRLTTMKGNHGG